MLNIFPIQFLAILAYFLLRIAVGLILIRFGVRHLRHARTSPLILTFGAAELVAGMLFILGLFTQIAALMGMALSLVSIFFGTRFALLESKTFYILLFFASLSLFITGAGIFAFDLPI